MGWTTMSVDESQNAFDAVRLRAAQIGAFETPILHGQLSGAAGLIGALRATVQARREAEPSLARSNVGGWHSATDMLDWGGDAAAQLARLALNAAKRISSFGNADPTSIEWSLKMWANVAPAGALHMSHSHPGVLWAAVFYVAMGEPDEKGQIGGELFFEDPRFPLPLMRMAGFRMIGIDGQPQANERSWPTSAGDIVLFPAWLRHGVRPYRGNGDRISIAMNIDVVQR